MVFCNGGVSQRDDGTKRNCKASTSNPCDVTGDRRIDDFGIPNIQVDAAAGISSIVFGNLRVGDYDVSRRGEQAATATLRSLRLVGCDRGASDVDGRRISSVDTPSKSLNGDIAGNDAVLNGKRSLSSARDEDTAARIHRCVVANCAIPR